MSDRIDISAGEAGPDRGAFANPVDEAVGAESRVLLKAVRIPDSGPISNEQKQEIRDTVAAHIQKHKVTQFELETAIDEWRSLISEALRGECRCEDTEILRKLNTWIEADERRRQRMQPIGFYSTGVFETIRGLAQYAKSNARVPGGRNDRPIVVQDSPRIVVGYGEAGVGKSIGAAALNAEDPLSVLIRVDQRRRTAAGVAALIIESAGWKSRRGEGSCIGVVMDRLRNSGRLLIVDEAHRLSNSGCELLRDLADVCGIPILLLSTRELYERLTRVRTRSGDMFYSQFSSRVGYACDLSRGLDGRGGSTRPIFSIDDIRAIFKADGVKLTHDGAEYLQAVACTPGLGTLRLAAGIFEKARRVASRASGVVDAALLRMSAERSLIPAGEADVEVLRQVEASLMTLRRLNARPDRRMAAG